MTIIKNILDFCYMLICVYHLQLCFWSSLLKGDSSGKVLIVEEEEDGEEGGKDEQTGDQPLPQVNLVLETQVVRACKQLHIIGDDKKEEIKVHHAT